MNRNKRGFSLLEMLVVVGIMGILMAAAYPGILNTLENRGLESAARDIQTSLQVAKFQAINTKLNHRVRFYNTTGPWAYVVEREVTSGTWSRMPKSLPKVIPNKYTATVTLPDAPAADTIVFDSVGLVANFDTAQRSVSLQSPKLKRLGQPDLRTIVFYYGGTIQYIKSST